jgi:hypothetical protein
MSRLAALCIALLGCIDAQASSCLPELVRSYSRMESEHMYATAREIFVGVLERIDSVPPRGGFHLRGEVTGVFRVSRRYKGGDAQQLYVYIDRGLSTGMRYLVYAEAENDELRADHDCAPQALPVGPSTEAWLAHLEHRAVGRSHRDAVCRRSFAEHRRHAARLREC